VVGSKSFDYGVVCGSEHQLAVDATVCEPFITVLRSCGAMVLSPEEVACFTERAFDSRTGHLRCEFVGQSAYLSGILSALVNRFSVVATYLLAGLLH
jgi:acetaldehyde dehydrogenase / alcohol dehydrogenase